MVCPPPVSPPHQHGTPSTPHLFLWIFCCCISACIRAFSRLRSHKHRQAHPHRPQFLLTRTLEAAPPPSAHGICRSLDKQNGLALTAYSQPAPPLHNRRLPQVLQWHGNICDRTPVRLRPPPMHGQPAGSRALAEAPACCSTAQALHARRDECGAHLQQTTRTPFPTCGRGCQILMLLSLSRCSTTWWPMSMSMCIHLIIHAARALSRVYVSNSRLTRPGCIFTHVAPGSGIHNVPLASYSCLHAYADAYVSTDKWPYETKRAGVRVS